MIWNIAVAISFAWIFNSVYEKALRKHLEERYAGVEQKCDDPPSKIRLSAALVIFIIAGLTRTDNIAATVDYLPLGVFYLICIADYRWHKIPNSYLIMAFIFILISLAVQIISSGEFVEIAKSSIIGFAVCGLPVLMTFVLSKGGFGMGDVKLMAIIGFWLGMGLGVTFFVATFVLSAIFSLSLIISKRLSPKSQIPLSPFMAVAAALCKSGIFDESVLLFDLLIK